MAPASGPIRDRDEPRHDEKAQRGSKERGVPCPSHGERGGPRCHGSCRPSARCYALPPIAGRCEPSSRRERYGHGCQRGLNDGGELPQCNRRNVLTELVVRGGTVITPRGAVI